MEYTDKQQEMEAIIQVELHEIEADEKYIVSFKRKGGSNMVFSQSFDEIAAALCETAN